jgi:hypothetical protein
LTIIFFPLKLFHFSWMIYLSILFSHSCSLVFSTPNKIWQFFEKKTCNISDRWIAKIFCWDGDHRESFLFLCSRYSTTTPYDYKDSHVNLTLGPRRSRSPILFSRSEYMLNRKQRNLNAREKTKNYMLLAFGFPKICW